MSYDVHFEDRQPCPDDLNPTHQHAQDDRNYTSNVSGMWEEAIGENLGDLIQRCPLPEDILPHIERGIAAMEAAPEKYLAMTPDNGWGGYDGALDYLRWIAQGCRCYAGRVISVSR